MELLTERLRLRAFEPADQLANIAMNLQSEVMRWLGGPRSADKTLAETEYNNRTLGEFGYGKVAVERRADGAFLGVCGLSIEDWYPDDLEIGWRLLPIHWGQGYATEAAKAWIAHAFSTLNSARVISISDVPNQRSIAVMERLGMKLDHTGELEIDGDRFEAVVYVLGNKDLA
ncbi:GNAT family N-acetyltransferase [Pseudorhodobacter sp.]|uniref:GNAT family N-acetyltransferase n=1 Tax=Pseudorhodobacter sp. TaxID=1934400 RepID=UPI0026486967|nr:GNAT family N-acetyltransferase [Pseudorhodobacter sp.]MDN5785497.1 GNAT family N-acetyltransferase [Pseudorhodobacter sp.]